MFLSDRSVILFNEYIDLAKVTYSNNTDFNINRTDIKIFIQKRTIGPIKIKNIKTKYNITIIKHLHRIEHVSNLFRSILTNTFFILIQYYEFNNDFREQLVEKGMTLSGLSPDSSLVEIVEIVENEWQKLQKIAEILEINTGIVETYNL